jgi:hypothetical protein
MGCSLTGTALEFVFFNKAIVCSVALIGDEKNTSAEFDVPAKRERSRAAFDFPEDVIGQIVSLRLTQETAPSGIEARGLSVVSPVVQWPAPEFRIENVAAPGEEHACDEVRRTTVYKIGSRCKLSRAWIKRG